MRRIALILLALALTGSYWGCSSDAPSPTLPNKSGGNPKPGTSPLLITLFTTDANPPAGSCTLIQAIVTFNGQAVADGTGVSFATDFGIFAQNSQPVVSIVTQKGSALAALCSTSTGTAFVTASATVNGVTAKSDQLKIVFQSTAAPVPFVTNCNPSFGPNTGGTPLTISGGNFSGTASTATATFTAAGITRPGLVTNETPTSVTIVTPAFPEATAPSVPVTITLNLGGITFTVPNCFAFGTASSSTPTVTALLPSSGSNDGGTRISIIGSGFSAPLQVFFGAVEAQIVSISYNQVVVISPRAFGGNLNAAVGVRVHEVTSGVDSNTNVPFQYVQPVLITAFSNNVQSIDFPFTTVTIFGQGFEAPVAVGLAGVGAFVTSVSATEIQVIPGPPVIDCSKGDITGPITITDIDTGNSGSGGSFTYVVKGTLTCAPTPTPVPPTPTPNPSAAPDLVVTKTAPATVSANTNVTFNIVVQNSGTAVANGCVVNDPVPAGTVFVSCSESQGSGCSNVGGTVIANLGVIPAGGFANVLITVNAGPPKVFTNNATASTSSAESNLGNNTGSATVTVQ